MKEKDKCVLLSVNFRNTIPALDTLCRNSIKYVCFVMLLSKRLTINGEINTACILLFLRYKNECPTEIIRMGHPKVQKDREFCTKLFCVYFFKTHAKLGRLHFGGNVS